tara:strand:+ start:3091 stop:4095 length:1005 start_codon:yes stop_codon:yes gene_type:complete
MIFFKNIIKLLFNSFGLEITTLKNINEQIKNTNKQIIIQNVDRVKNELNQSLKQELKKELKQELIILSENLINKNANILKKQKLSYENGKFIVSKFSKPYYAYTVYHAIKLAMKLGHSRVSVIEFGVASGRGLVCLETVSSQLEELFDIKIDIYGFDMGTGLLAPKNNMDLKYWFQSGQYKMDEESLRGKLKKSKLIIGDVNQTIDGFISKYKPAPIAAIMHDLDYYSSTKNSFKLLNNNIEFFLPRVYCYFDDTVGSELEMYNEYTGQLAAIQEFNLSNKDKKFSKNRNLINYNDKWRKKIYHLHMFNHPDYDVFIGKEEQENMMNKLKEIES